MRNDRLAPKALVLSTVPPMPREYGNRNRVHQMLAFLRSSGFSISFLLYPLDQEWQVGVPETYREMVDSFDYFAIIPNTRKLHQPAQGYHHHIDEWWDEAIGHHIAWLLARRRFDLVFVNYVFFSKAFECARGSGDWPGNPLCILDTHDLFAGRRELLERHGAPVEFFYTACAEESVGFARADCIIAIKPSEGAVVRSMTDTPVISVPYWDDRSGIAGPGDGPSPTFSHGRPLRLGFIGVRNASNVINMQRFLSCFDRYVRLYDLTVELRVAGDVCGALDDCYAFLRKLGRIADIADFYQHIDAVITPFEFSTGIKTKIAEALAWPRPVIATRDAFDGFRAFHPSQCADTITELCDWIASIATNEVPYSVLLTAARRAGEAAARAQQKGLAALGGWIATRVRRIVVVTDRAFWRRATLLDESIAHGVEHVNHIAPVIVVYVGTERVDAADIYGRPEVITVETAGPVGAVLTELAGRFAVAGILHMLASLGARHALEAAAASMGVESWSLGLQVEERGARVAIAPRSAPEQAITVAPLRYVPPPARQALDRGRVLIVTPTGIDDWEAAVADYLRRRSAEEGFVTRLVETPEDGAEDAGYFRALAGETALRIVLFERDKLAQLFGLQLATLRGALVLLIGRSWVSPQAYHAGHPSLHLSIEHFLAGESGCAPTVGPDTGWSTLWSRLA